MFDEALLVMGLLLSSAYLIRTGLILIGLLKSPVLRCFERYSTFNDAYYPLPGLLAGLGVLVLCLSVLLRGISGTTFPAYLPGLLILLLAVVAHRAFGLASRFPGLFLGLPKWYAELRERTTREERRRIAFMWLALPRRTRLYYEWHTRAFTHWVDLVIVSTGTQTFEDIMRMMISARR